MEVRYLMNGMEQSLLLYQNWSSQAGWRIFGRLACVTRATKSSPKLLSTGYVEWFQPSLTKLRVALFLEEWSRTMSLLVLNASIGYDAKLRERRVMLPSSSTWARRMTVLNGLTSKLSCPKWDSPLLLLVWSWDASHQPLSRLFWIIQFMEISCQQEGWDKGIPSPPFFLWYVLREFRRC